MGLFGPKSQEQIEEDRGWREAHIPYTAEIIIKDDDGWHKEYLDYDRDTFFRITFGRWITARMHAEEDAAEIKNHGFTLRGETIDRGKSRVCKFYPVHRIYEVNTYPKIQN